MELLQIKLFKHLLSPTATETLPVWLGLHGACAQRSLPLAEGKTTFGNKARPQRQVLHWTSPPSNAAAPVASSLGCNPLPTHPPDIFPDPKEDQVLPSDPKGNCTDNKDLKRSKWNYNPRGPSAPSPPCGDSGPPHPPGLFQSEGPASCPKVVRPGCRFSGTRG